MIIGINGTCGAGKSTLVRKLMSYYVSKKPSYIEGREKPIGYNCVSRGIRRPNLWVLGHYEHPDGGGCDTLAPIPDKNKFIYDSIKKAHTSGKDVLCEGLGIERSVWAKLHAKGLPIVLIELDVTVDECMVSVSFPKVIIEYRDRVSRHMSYLKKKGIEIHKLDREAALAFCLNTLVALR